MGSPTIVSIQKKNNKKHGSLQRVPISLFLGIIILKQKTVFIMYLYNLPFDIFLNFHYKSDHSHLDKSEMMKKYHKKYNCIIS